MSLPTPFSLPPTYYREAGTTIPGSPRITATAASQSEEPKPAELEVPLFDGRIRRRSPPSAAAARRGIPSSFFEILECERARLSLSFSLSFRTRSISRFPPSSRRRRGNAAEGKILMVLSNGSAVKCEHCVTLVRYCSYSIGNSCCYPHLRLCLI